MKKPFIVALGLVWAGCSDTANVPWLQPSPSEVSATAIVEGVTVSWSDTPLTSSYNVYVAAGDTVSVDSYDTMFEDVVSPLDVPLALGDHAFIVTAVNGEGLEGDPSPILRGSPLARDVMPSLDPILSIRGEADGDDFGRVTMSPGDLNGDGLNDLIIGARGNDAAGADSGRVYVYLRTPTGLPPEPSQILDGPVLNGRFGHAIMPAGDVNGDGKADVVIAAPGLEGNTDFDALICLFYGSDQGLETDPAWSIQNNGGQFGYRFELLNFNGDEYIDLAAGLKSGTNTLNNEGAVAVYFGSASGFAANPDWIIYGGGASARVGEDIAVGDINGDGIDDIAAGGSGWDTANNNVGTVQLYLGANGTPDTVADLTLVGTQAGEQLGVEIQISNVNGDAFDDLVVGHSGWDEGSTNDGLVTIHYGAETPVDTAGWLRAGAGLQQGLAHASERCDVNLDGFEDVVIGSDGDATEGTAGTLQIFLGTTGGPGAEPWFETTPKAVGLGYARRIFCGVDLTGDGYPEILTQDYNDGPGVAHVYLGPLGFGPTVRLGKPVYANGSLALAGADVAPIPLVTGGTCEIAWGDGSTEIVDDCNTGTLAASSHAYNPGTYEIEVTFTDAIGTVGRAVTRAEILP